MSYFTCRILNAVIAYMQTSALTSVALFVCVFGFGKKIDLALIKYANVINDKAFVTNSRFIRFTLLVKIKQKSIIENRIDSVKLVGTPNFLRSKHLF
jgi:hypothetical protein